MNSLLGQISIALIFVILLILATALVYKKRYKGSGLISVEEYLSFGPKRGIAAFKVGREILIVGITPYEFRLLKTLDEEMTTALRLQKENEKLSFKRLNFSNLFLAAKKKQKDLG
jgi:flagellar biogenesis protein FliO